MSSNIGTILHINIMADRQPPKNTDELLAEDVPINTKQQLFKNIMHWRQQLSLIAIVTKRLSKPTLTLTQKSDMVKQVLTFTSKIKGNEHYWLFIMVPVKLRGLSNTVIFSDDLEFKKKFCNEYSSNPYSSRYSYYNLPLIFHFLDPSRHEPIQRCFNHLRSSYA